MNGPLERTLLIGLTASAVAMAAAVVYREFVPAAGSASANYSDLGRPEFYSDWRNLLAIARPMGDTLGPIRLIEFSDLECPACRFFHQTTLPLLREQFGSQLSTSLIHLPLRIHRFADRAAHAAECAAYQGRFREYVELTFEKQDSVGLKDWTSFGVEAGAGDSVAFAQCLSNTTARVLVDSGVVIADRLQITATPTVIVNGWRVPSPSAAELERVIAELLADRKPFP